MDHITPKKGFTKMGDSKRCAKACRWQVEEVVCLDSV